MVEYYTIILILLLYHSVLCSRESRTAEGPATTLRLSLGWVGVQEAIARLREGELGRPSW